MAYIGQSIKNGTFSVLDTSGNTYNGSNTTFNLGTQVGSPAQLLVSHDGVIQLPGTDYTLASGGTQITFTTAPASGASIFIVEISGAVGGPMNTDINGAELILDVDGDTSITADTDDQIDFKAGGTDTMHVINGKVGITNVPDLGAGLHIKTSDTGGSVNGNGDELVIEANGNAGLSIITGSSNTGAIFFADADDANVGGILYDHATDANAMTFRVGDSVKAVLNTSGVFMIGDTTGDAIANNGINLTAASQILISRGGGDCGTFNRNTNDGVILNFAQATSTEGNISVSGSTVSYNGFTGTHWSRLADNSKPTILRGTIMESLDEMCDWYQAVADVAESTDEEGNVIPAHQVKKSIALGSKNVGDSITFTHNGVEHTGTVVKEGDVKHSKCKISDTSESKAVYGVFQAWDNDDDTVNDMYVAQTGTFVVRLNSSVTTLNKGDLIQSNGDGTGKVQADDIIRASTVAKVLSTTKIETYSDGSYIVPCSLHC